MNVLEINDKDERKSNNNNNSNNSNYIICVVQCAFFKPFILHLQPCTLLHRARQNIENWRGECCRYMYQVRGDESARLRVVQFMRSKV